MSKELSPEEQAAQESAAEASRQEEAIEGLPGSMIELAQKYPGLRKALGPLLTMGILATPAVAGAESKPRAAIIDTSESDEVRDQQDYQPVPTTVNEKALQKVKPEDQSQVVHEGIQLKNAIDRYTAVEHDSKKPRDERTGDAMEGSVRSEAGVDLDSQLQRCIGLALAKGMNVGDLYKLDGIPQEMVRKGVIRYKRELAKMAAQPAAQALEGIDKLTREETQGSPATRRAEIKEDLGYLFDPSTKKPEPKGVKKVRQAKDPERPRG